MSKITKIMAAMAAYLPSVRSSVNHRYANRRYVHIKNKEARQRRGSQYARDHKGEPGRNGGPKGY